MKKVVYFIYAVICYVIFFTTLLYLIGFVENFSDFPIRGLFLKTLDHGPSLQSAVVSVFVDLLLIALFGIQHSVMARQNFKEKWTKFIPQPIERSTFVLFASMALIVLFHYWQPVKIVLWDISHSDAGAAVIFISMLGWLMLLITIFAINHFDLFGLRQTYLYIRNEELGHISFRTPLFYRLVRLPIYLSFLTAFWFAPLMTLGHLVFNLGMTAYVLIGIYHEERDLVKLFGKDYDNYLQEVPKLIPFTKSSRKGIVMKSEMGS